MDNKELQYNENQQEYLYMKLKDSYIETCNDEYIKTGIINPTNFRDFLVIHMNYSVEEANEITQNFKKYDNKFSKRTVETVA